MDTVTDRAFDVLEARRLLGDLSNGKIYELIASGELRSFRVGRRRLVSQRAIAEFIRAREAEAAA